MSEQQWDDVSEYRICKSVFNFTRQVAYTMLKQQGGSIITRYRSSVVGLAGQGGQSNYAASKAGIIGFTKSIADELGSRNIRCNAIAPGFIRTDMTDQLTPALQKEYFARIPLKPLLASLPAGNGQCCPFPGIRLVILYLHGQVIMPALVVDCTGKRPIDF